MAATAKKNARPFVGHFFASARPNPQLSPCKRKSTFEFKCEKLPQKASPKEGMTRSAPAPTMTVRESEATPLDFLLPPLQSNRVVLVVDLVESVRLMSVNETAVVSQWHNFVQHALQKVLPDHGGRLVKSLGDGLLAEFDVCSMAIQATLKLQRYFDLFNATTDADSQMQLRAGLHITHLYRGEQDVYGHGVNLAARIASLAEPGETVVTAAVRDAMVDGVDGDVEDMGESYLKHWPEPVRTWRVHPVSTTHFTWRPERREAPATDFRPSIAIIPFEARTPSPEHFVIGELIADGVIAQLARSQHIRVISRLSTTAFRGRGATAGEIDASLDTPFVLSGGYASLGHKVMITAELADTRRGEVVWAERLSGDTMDLMQAESELINTLSKACAHALLNAEVQRSLVQPLPKLDSNALMLGGITLMHRSTPRDLQRSQQLLEAVAERHKRVAAPWAWLAKWHIMQVVQGMSGDPANDFRRAVSVADRALDLEPNSALAMAIKGHALCHLGSDVDGSHRLLQEATQSNPNDPMAWLYNSVWSQMWGTPEESLIQAESALNLSPLDPQKYYFEMMLANSCLSLGRLEQGIDLCKSSLLKNRYHLPTIRALLICQYELGQLEEARTTFDLMRSLQPGLTIEKYLASGSQSSVRQRGAKALVALGLPAH
jgi:class 3 adenylate cyclase/TolB-like protein